MAGRGTYAALDLGTNNCRLLVARPTAEGFRVIDAFSRIVRLGEGLSLTGRLSEAAIARTLEALKVCRDKMAARGVTRARTIATEACRSAANGPAFVATVRERLGIELEIVDRETEAHLAAAGVGDLADKEARSTVMFDIGGGSSEIIWLDFRSPRAARPEPGQGLGVAAARGGLAGRDVRRRRRDRRGLRRHDRLRLGGARAVRRQSGDRGALRALPSPRHVGHGDDHRRRASQPRRVTTGARSTASGSAGRRSTGRSRACAP